MNNIRHYIITLLLSVLGTASLFSQELPASIEQSLFSHGPTNMGRDFWLAFPANWDLPGSSQYYIRLYITSPVRTQVKVWTTGNIKKVINTIPNKVVTIDLVPSEAQMLVRNDQPPVPPDRVFKNKAVHVEAGAPIAVYGMNTTNYSTEGLLALPVNALGREYVVASYGAVVGVSQELPSQYLIIAPYDGTIVTVTHPHRTPSHAAGETFTIDLDRGDVWSAMTVGYNGDMSGVTIRANKPVAVTAGHACTYVPNLLGFCCCDHISEMMFPASSWGKIYHGTPIQTRLKGDFYRVFAKEPNTKVMVDGKPYATLTSVGGEEGTGWFEYRALGRFPVEFSADKPIYVTQYNTSGAYDGLDSDPFYQALTPLEQYQTSLFFATPNADFPQNFLNIACQEDGYQEVEITEAGENRWRPLYTLPGSAVPQRYPTLIDDKRYITMTVALQPGVYQMRSRTPFAAYLNGFSNADSYGYPLGAGVANREISDRSAPVIASKQQSCDGSVSVRVQDTPLDDAGRTNLATVELDPDPAVTSNFDLKTVPFEAGVSSQTTYTLTVTDKSKPARAVVIISDMAGNLVLDTVEYQPRGIAGLSAGANFGKVRAGEVVTRTVRLENSTELPASVSGIFLKSGSQNFRIISPSGAAVIPPHGGIDVEIEFTAELRGRTTGLIVFEDSVGVRDSCGMLYAGVIKGQIVKPMILVTDHDFGTVPAGVKSGEWTMQVTNTSLIEGSTLALSSRNGPANPAVFAIEGTNASLPLMLEPGQSLTLTITARPPAPGEYRDTIFFQNDAIEGDAFGWLQVGTTTASVGTPGGIAAVGSLEVVPNLTDRDEVALRYSLRQPAILAVTLIDAAGREARVFRSEVPEETGTHSMSLDLKGLAAGTYAVKIESNGETDLRRLVIVR